MPEKTLTRNKTGGWDSTSKPLASEIEQKKQGLVKPDNAQQNEEQRAEKTTSSTKANAKKTTNASK